jgi:NAD(P)-dependent dehydrogenase (short-subunit alcohol dehydrogenase family)
MAEPRKDLAVLITGCSSGFGELIARTLAQAGHYVFATMRDCAGRNKDAALALDQWGRARGLKLDVLDLDVTQDQSVNAAIAEAISRAGRLDVAVSNAGASARGPLEAFSIEEMQALFNLNVFGPMRVAQAVLPSMRKRGSGLLIHVSSTLGRVLPGTGGLYPSTKWALEGITESLRYQVMPFGVEVIIVEPGSFPTPATGKSAAASRTEITLEYEALSAARPSPRSAPGTPPDNQEVADAIKRLIHMPQGRRPMRTVVGPVFTEGVEEYNRLYEQTRDRLARSLGRPAPSWPQGTVADAAVE